MTSPPSAGWYPDPAGNGPLRYWDGQSWTDPVPQPSQEERRDAAKATALMVVACGLAGLFGMWSMFAMMIPADGCNPDKCRQGLISVAYMMALIGLPTAVIGGLVGIGRATKRKLPRAVPAKVSLIAVVVIVVAWFVLMGFAIPTTMW